ncbi:CerR family C-terminal domain-containing protein [Brevundimonas sp. DS20]|uniref:CerR family C-terminal domain-containing protein n=1 Tax=Brevundimonas sp. DS20 TaxID=1532555 RepID=UPI0006D042B2|nr:CerR family C-terminal domain-containing protein [Brevundimonas sp. DS20]ALJ06946.1 hypothetical protein JL11_00285 [Brevundimonas sp. DS20]
MGKTETTKGHNPDETRRRLVEAGLDLFGRGGLDAVSTRQLADAAGVNLNAIQYHFGGKEEVYLAVASHIVESTGAAIRAAAEAIAADADNLKPDEAAWRVGKILSSVVGVIFGTPDASTRGAFMLREQMQPGRAFDLIYEGYVEAVHRAISALCARARGLEADDPEAIIQAHAMFGQALAFGVARDTLARRLGRAQLGIEDLSVIGPILEGSARRALIGDGDGPTRAATST